MPITAPRSPPTPPGPTSTTPSSWLGRSAHELADYPTGITELAKVETRYATLGCVDNRRYYLGRACLATGGDADASAAFTPVMMTAGSMSAGLRYQR